MCLDVLYAEAMWKPCYALCEACFRNRSCSAKHWGFWEKHYISSFKLLLISQSSSSPKKPPKKLKGYTECLMGKNVTTSSKSDILRPRNSEHQSYDNQLYLWIYFLDVELNDTLLNREKSISLWSVTQIDLVFSKWFCDYGKQMLRVARPSTKAAPHDPRVKIATHYKEPLR